MRYNIFRYGARNTPWTVQEKDGDTFIQWKLCSSWWHAVWVWLLLWFGIGKGD